MLTLLRAGHAHSREAATHDWRTTNLCVLILPQRPEIQTPDGHDRRRAIRTTTTCTVPMDYLNIARARTRDQGCDLGVDTLRLIPSSKGQPPLDHAMDAAVNPLRTIKAAYESAILGTWWQSSDRLVKATAQLTCWLILMRKRFPKRPSPRRIGRLFVDRRGRSVPTRGEDKSDKVEGREGS